MRYSIYGENNFKETINKLLLKAGHIIDNINPEFVFSVGGDGTILRAINQFINNIETVKFVGINLGRLGFYTDFEESEIDLLLSLIDNNQYKIFNYNLIEYNLISKGNKYTGYSLNELAIINPIHTQIIDVYIEQEYFETFRGTGFLLSTPTGSTAYNKSLGGSVIDPRIKAIQVTEIASINNRVFKTLSSPIILPSDAYVRLRSDYTNSFFSSDGMMIEKKDITDVVCRLSNKQVSFVVKDEGSFWKRVKRSFLE
jgi:NAD+ kinase